MPSNSFGESFCTAEDFSPNTPQGACPTCHGLGHVYEVTEANMVPDPSLSIRERAIASWPPAWQGQNLRDILVSMGYDVDRPWKDLPKKDRDWILFTEETPTVPVYAGFTPAETRTALKRKMEPRANRALPATARGSSPKRCRLPSLGWTSARLCRYRWTTWRHCSNPSHRAISAPMQRVRLQTRNRPGASVPNALPPAMRSMRYRPTCAIPPRCRKKSASPRSAWLEA